jgi:hypothetical protein
VLLDRAAGADLLVLGATTPAVTGSPAGRCGAPTAGPVARACLSGAVCPVVIVSAAVTCGDGQPGATGAAPAAASPFGYRGDR